MGKKKGFDCVQMKWDIQQKLSKEYHGLSAEEVRRLRAKRIEEDPVMGPWIRGIRTIHSSTRVSEK